MNGTKGEPVVARINRSQIGLEEIPAVIRQGNKATEDTSGQEIYGVYLTPAQALEVVTGIQRAVREGRKQIKIFPAS